MTEPRPQGPGQPGSLSYAAAGVDTRNEDQALAGLLGWVRRTFEHRPPGSVGHAVLDVGYFASVLRLTETLGLAVSADGVGTKLLVAQLAGRYDGCGIDLVAMNVNDLLCVGAEPIALLDYVAIEALDGALLEQLGRGLYEGARQAGIVIAGGELAQIGAMLRGAVPGKAFDLAAVALGVVPLDRVEQGAHVQPGDVVVGLASSGIHSNGLSLARRALLEQGGLQLGDPLPGGAGETVADALLEPTRIYVKPVLELLRDPAVTVTALAHITGAGFENMARIAAPCGYVLDALPPVPAIFRAVESLGRVGKVELYTAFNMGVGFTITARPGGERRVLEVARAHGIEAWVLGRAEASLERRVRLPQVGLQTGRDGFEEVA